MNKISFNLTILLIVLFINVGAEEIQLINFGNLKGRQPAVEKEFDHELGIRLSTIEGMNLMDKDKSDLLKKRSDFVNMPTLSQKLINSLRESAEEKSLLVWCEIKDLSIKPKRKWVLGAEAVGQMKVKLYMYSLYFGEYIFTGEISSQASKAKAPVFFRNVEKITHITSEERQVLSRKMASDILIKIEDLVISVTRSELIKTGILLPEEIKKEKAPSVSDMFNIPSVEAPEVDE